MTAGAVQASRRLAGYGFSAVLPDRWEGRIFRRVVGSADERTEAGGTAAPIVLPRASGWDTERSHAVVHLANFALPAVRGDYGSGAVELMGEAHLFLALLEFGPDCLGSALFAPAGLPELKASDFDPNGLQRRIAGQAGFQHFCTVNQRPLCVYAVLGSYRRAAAASVQLNTVLRQVEVGR